MQHACNLLTVGREGQLTGPLEYADASSDANMCQTQ